MVEYKINEAITVPQFIDILERSQLAKRRPVGNISRITKMLEHGNLTITAWDENKLIGVMRAVTDFAYCCYLSELAVDVEYQSHGIGKSLLNATHTHLGDGVSIFLLAAPNSVSFYRHFGLKNVSNGFVWGREF